MKILFREMLHICCMESKKILLFLLAPLLLFLACFLYKSVLDSLYLFIFWLLGAFNIAIVLLWLKNKLYRERQNKVDLLQEVNNAGIWHFDIKKDILLWDKKMCFLHGIYVESLKGNLSTWYELLHEEDIQKVKQFLNNITSLKEKNTLESEFRIVRANDGQIRYLKGKVKIVYDKQGKAEKVIGVKWDITEQKKLEIEKKEADNLYFKIFEESEIVNLIVDAENLEIVDANKKALDFYGYTKQEIIGMKMSKINILPEKQIFEAIQKVKSGQCNNFFFRHKTKNDHIYEVEVFLLNVKIKGKDYVYSHVVDITEKKMLETINEQIKNNFDVFFNTIDDMLFVLDISGDMMYINDAVCKKLGYQREELLGNNVLLVHPENQRDDAMQIIQAMLNGEKDACFIPLQCKDGKKIAVETKVVHGKWNDENVLFGVSKDISDLKLSEAKFAAAFYAGTVLMGISRLDNGVYIDVNDEFLKVLGFKKEEVIGVRSQDLNIFVDYNDRIRLKKLFEKQGFVKNEEVMICKKNRQIMYGLFSAEKMAIEGDALWVTVITDISERKLAEKKIKESEERLHLATSGAMVGLWDWNIITGETVFNEEWAMIIGYSLEEIKPTNINTWLKFGHKEDLKKSETLLAEHFQGKTEYYECAVRMRHKKGYWVWILDKGKVIEWSEDGKPKRMLGTHIDITKSKELELALKEAKTKADAANIAKEQFLSNMSHEMRNPLNGIVGMLTLLESTDLTKEQKEYLDDAKSASDILLVLINDILDFSKIEAGKLLMEQAEFDLKQAIDDTVKLFMPKIKEKGLWFYQALERDIPQTVLGDVVRTKQIFNNLLSNAVKFTNAGKITIKGNKIFEDEKNVKLKFEIADSGIGIADEVKKRLFKPFEQEDASWTKKFGGTGLGLAISKNLANMMDGDITCDSVKNQGSVFTIILVFKKIEKTKETALKFQDTNSKIYSKVNKLSKKELKILIVDDDKINCRVLKLMLEKQGYFCQTAFNGKEVLERCIDKKENYDVVFMDGEMPILDGYEATIMIRDYELSQNLKKKLFIVAMTANAMPGDKERCLQVGMNEYISKPINFKAVEMILEKVALSIVMYDEIK